MWQYEIKDFSSRYFGDCFVVFNNGIPFATERTFEEAYRRITRREIFIDTGKGFEPLEYCTKTTFT